MLVGDQHTVAVRNLHDDRGMISVCVSIGVASILKLDDVTWADAFFLPVDPSAPNPAASVLDSCGSVSQVD